MCWQNHNIHAAQVHQVSQLRAINGKKVGDRASYPSGNVPRPISVRSGGRAIPLGRPLRADAPGDHAAGQQVHPRFAIRAQVQTANNIGNWLIAEEGSHHHPDNYASPCK